MKSKNKFPIFYDPLHRRWRHFQKVFKLFGLTFLVILIAFLVSISIQPILTRCATKF